MKALYTFGGMSHYLNAMLNKLHEGGVEVTVIAPQKGNATIGKGVKIVEGDVYGHFAGTEKKAFYGKSAYPASPKIVRKERPDILVVGRSYFLQVLLQPGSRKTMEECRTRLVIRGIPFQTPPYGKIKGYLRKNPMYDENMRLVNTGTGFYLKQWLAVKICRHCYTRATETLNYSTVAYDVLPSYGVEREQIHATYNSTDTESLLKEKETTFASAPLLPHSVKRALHTGQLVRWERVGLLIDASPKVTASHPDVELVIVGDGLELDNLKK